MNPDMETEEGRFEFFLNVLAKAPPEHYAFPPCDNGIVEVMGEHVARMRVDRKYEVRAS